MNCKNVIDFLFQVLSFTHIDHNLKRFYHGFLTSDSLVSFQVRPFIHKNNKLIKLHYVFLYCNFLVAFYMHS